MAEQILNQIWNYVNEALQIDCGKFNPRHFCTRAWYLAVVEILLPQLEDQWPKIQQEIQSQQAAIDRILLLLVQEGIIDEEFIEEIKGNDIVNGQFESVHQMAQLMKEMVQQALEDDEENQAPQEDQPKSVKDPRIATEQNKITPRGSKQTNNQKLSSKQSVEKMSDKKEKIHFGSNQSKRHQSGNRANSDPSQSRNFHSVQGIGDEFDDQESAEPQDSGHIGPFHTKNNQGTGIGNYQNEEITQNHYYQNPGIDQEYIQQQLKKHKSQQRLPINNQNKKSKKRFIKEAQVLVTHPKIPKKYPKSTTIAQKKLTTDVKKSIFATRQANKVQIKDKKSPAGHDILSKKKRQLNYITNNPNRIVQKQVKISSNKIQKLLNWREASLKRQQRAAQQGMLIKIQQKRQNYLKKVNHLILTLQKQKIREAERDQKQRLLKERQIAEVRLMSIENQYRNQISLLHETKNDSKKTLIHTDHKAILQELQKQLKKQNEKQINSIKLKMKRQQAMLDDDLENLQKEIINIYKRN